MAYRQRREKLRSILTGMRCIRPGSVYDAISIRIAQDAQVIPSNASTVQFSGIEST